MDFPIVTTGDASVLDAFYSRNKRLGIVTCAGGNRNAFSGGAMIYWRRMGWVNRPDAFIGVSSGIGSNGYFTGGSRASCVKVFANDMSDRRMFDIRRRLSGGYPFDVDYVDRVFRGTETGRGIKAENVCRHPASFYGVLAHAVTGKPHIYKAESPEDVWTLSSYGTAVTGFGRPMEYRGLPITDGYFSEQQMPVEWLVDEEELTDVLVFAGGDYDPNPQPSHWVEQLIYRSGFARASRPVQELIKTRQIRFMETAQKVVTLPYVRVFIIWVPERLSPIYVSEGKSRELVQRGYRTMEELFKRRRL